MERAANLVMENIGKEFSLRNVAKQFNIHYSTLSRFITKIKRNADKDQHAQMIKPITSGYQKNRQVFSIDIETILNDYIRRSSDILYGLTPIEVGKLAYECATKFGVSVPPSWEERKMAGADWLNLFLKKKTLTYQFANQRQPA